MKSSVVHADGYITGINAIVPASVVKKIYHGRVDSKYIGGCVFTVALHSARSKSSNHVVFHMTCFLMTDTGKVLCDTNFDQSTLKRRAPHFFEKTFDQINAYKLINIEPIREQLAFEFANTKETLTIYLPRDPRQSSVDSE